MKNNTNELKKQLQSILKGICTSVYYEIVRENKKYPYLIYEIKQLSYEAGCSSYEIEINCVDKNESTALVDEVADQVQNLLEGYEFANDKISFYTYTASRQTVYEEDKNLKRRRLTVELRLYSKEV